MGLEHWLQLSLTQGIGPILAGRIVQAAGDVEAACRADARLLGQVQGIGSGKSHALAAALRKAAAHVGPELQRAAAQGVTIVCFDDSSYPPLLRSIPDPPAVLYARGSLEPRDLNAMAIVGSRRCSLYGREQAERFGALLAGAGVTVVSGGARGVDSAAHRGAIAAHQGRTIAVLGSGIDVPYPPENVTLFSQIAEHGAVLSEFPMGTPPNKENFPRRNRIVSGMSRGVLVIEADQRSGALITARQACDDHGRPVFAVPGRVDNPLSAGPHQLLRDGAAIAANLEDVLDGLGPVPHALTQGDLFDSPSQPSTSQPAETASAPAASRVENAGPVSEQQAMILLNLGPDPMTLEGLIESTGLAPQLILRELTFLTLKGRVRRNDGQTWSRRMG